jgi:putative modified peptide
MPFKLTPKVVDELLDKLSSDDAFRDRFQADPRAALAEVGDESAKSAGPGARGPWSCLTVAKLAPKEQITASREVLRQQLSAEGMYTPFRLEAD